MRTQPLFQFFSVASSQTGLFPLLVFAKMAIAGTPSTARLSSIYTL